jgi:hypothetical protein
MFSREDFSVFPCFTRRCFLITRLPPLAAYEREQYLQRHSTFMYLFKYIVSGSSAGIWLKTQLVRGLRVAGDDLDGNRVELPDSDDSDSRGVEQRYGSTASSVQLRDGKEVEGGDSWDDILTVVLVVMTKHRIGHNLNCMYIDMEVEVRSALDQKEGAVGESTVYIPQSTLTRWFSDCVFACRPKQTRNHELFRRFIHHNT